MKIVAAILKIHMKYPQKPKIKSPIWLTYTTPWHMTQGLDIQLHKMLTQPSSVLLYTQLLGKRNNLDVFKLMSE